MSNLVHSFSNCFLLSPEKGSFSCPDQGNSTGRLLFLLNEGQEQERASSDL